MSLRGVPTLSCAKGREPPWQSPRSTQTGRLLRPLPLQCVQGKGFLAKTELPARARKSLKTEASSPALGQIPLYPPLPKGEDSPSPRQAFRSPRTPMVTSLMGISFPLRRAACFAMCNSPEQQGTSMCTTVRLLTSECRSISVSFPR